MSGSVDRLPIDDALTDSSLALLSRAKRGDAAALDALLERYRPRLLRWAHRRLPHWARDLAETDDLVQDTLRAPDHWRHSACHDAAGIRPLRDVRPDLPGDFVGVVERCLAHDPKKRIGSAAELERALRAIQTGTQPPGRRSRTWIVLAGLGAIAAVGMADSGRHAMPS
jgi:hypothetical protein